MKKTVKDKLKAWKWELEKTLKDLISIPTSNPPGLGYRECADYISKKLDEWGIEHRVITVPDPKYPRFSIIGSYGHGMSGLHFHGHYDVVPASSSALFTPQLERGLLYGRGSSDMKGGLVVILYALRLLKELPLFPRGRISFSFVPDEETGGAKGTRYLLENNLLPENCLGMLMPEPTSGSIWNANKGALTYKIIISGKSAHVGLAYQGVNAFEQMVELAHSFQKIKKKVEMRKTCLPGSLKKTSRSVMLIGGEAGSGVSFNLVPEKSYFTLDLRLNPEEDMSKAREEIEKVIERHRKRGMKIKAEVLQEGEPSVVSVETELAQALKKAIFEVKKFIPKFELCPGLCEIRYFHKLNIPAYAYGPGLIEVAHCPKEYVRMKDVLDCTLIYFLTAYYLMGDKKLYPEKLKRLK